MPGVAQMLRTFKHIRPVPLDSSGNTSFESREITWQEDEFQTRVV